MTVLETTAVVPDAADALTPTDAGAADRLMRKPDGSPCSRQRVEQVETEALRKLRPNAGSDRRARIEAGPGLTKAARS
jgi:hypothetical protein